MNDNKDSISESSQFSQTDLQSLCDSNQRPDLKHKRGQNLKNAISEDDKRSSRLPDRETRRPDRVPAGRGRGGGGGSEDQDTGQAAPRGPSSAQGTQPGFTTTERSNL